MARYDDEDQATGEDGRALDGERPKTYRSDDWQRMDTSLEEDEAKQPWSKRTKLALVGLALAAVFATAVALLQWLKAPQPACILLAGARYDTNLLFPPNVLGWKGLEAIDSWANKQFNNKRWLLWNETKGMRPFGRLEDHELKSGRNWEELVDKLPELRDGTFTEET